MIVGLLAGQYLSQWILYRQTSVSGREAAKSLRDLASPNLKRVYINLICPKSMVEAMKNNESEVKVNVNEVINTLMDAVNVLNERVLALEKALIHVQHTNTDDGSRHKDDGGWFD